MRTPLLLLSLNPGRSQQAVLVSQCHQSYQFDLLLELYSLRLCDLILYLLILEVIFLKLLCQQINNSLEYKHRYQLVSGPLLKCCKKANEHVFIMFHLNFCHFHEVLVQILVFEILIKVEDLARKCF